MRCRFLVLEARLAPQSLGITGRHRLGRRRKLPYWVFVPFGLALVGSIGLIWYRPADSPVWPVWCALGCLIASYILTAVLWGRWQAKLSKDPLGPASPYLAQILSTHWIRTLLINAYAFILLAWAIERLTWR